MPKPRSTAPTPIASRLAHVDATAADVARLLHDRRCLAACQAIAPGLSFGPVRQAPGGVLRCLHLRCDAGDVQVLFSSPGRPGLALLADEGAEATPVLAEAAAEAVFGPVADFLHSLGLHGARAVAVREHPLPAPSGAGWCVVRHDDLDLATFNVAEVPAIACTVLRDHLRRTAIRPVGFEHLRLRGVVELSTRSLRVVLLNSLARGDVVLLDTNSPESGSADCQVRFGALGGRRWCAGAQVEDTLIIIQGEPRMSDDEFEQEQEQEAGLDDEAGDLDTLEIPVRFEVDTARLSLAELRGLGPGSVIALATPLASASLRLVAGGRVVGHAELVAVGDRLGARIVRMASGGG